MSVFNGESEKRMTLQITSHTIKQTINNHSLYSTRQTNWIRENRDKTAMENLKNYSENLEKLYISKCCWIL